MRVLKIFLSILVILVSTFLVGGFLISDEWVVSRSIFIYAHPQQIYPFISNFKEWEKWSPWNAKQDATLQYTYQNTKIGKGTKQTWKSEKMGKGWMEFTSMSPQTGVAYDLYIDMGRSQSILHGTLSFADEGEGTRVTWTDRGESGKSFIKRWMNFLIKFMLKKDFDTGLANLKVLVEKHN
ncbi:MAG: Vegetative cell wall protein gp1 precursor [Gammaproteobacteria bacterium]|jgi:hypothetical protein|nr:Vegetative cell wall protein gp1 precursor [Gammaproteobacteria bacterium]